MRLFLGIFLLGMWYAGVALAQTDTLQIVDTVAFSMTGAVSGDRYGNLYLAGKHGSVHKTDSAGHFSLVFSPERVGQVSLIEARNPLAIFVFYRDLQQYLLLDRFLSPVETHHFDSPEINFVRLATPAADNQVWLLDDMDFAIKKFDPRQNRISLQVPLDLILKKGQYDISWMAEYQNQLFLLDRNSGIFVFDNMGNYKYHIEAPGIEYFNFLNEEIYFIKNHEVIVVHLYQQEKKSFIITGKPDKITRVFIHNSRIFLFAPGYVFICAKN